LVRVVSKRPCLEIDGGCRHLLASVSPLAEDHDSSLVAGVWAASVITTRGECKLSTYILQVLRVSIVDGRLGTVELALLMNSSSLKVRVRGNRRVLTSGRDVREGSREHVSLGHVGLRV